MNGCMSGHQLSGLYQGLEARGGAPSTSSQADQVRCHSQRPRWPSQRGRTKGPTSSATDPSRLRPTHTSCKHATCSCAQGHAIATQPRAALPRASAIAVEAQPVVAPAKHQSATDWQSSWQPCDQGAHTTQPEQPDLHDSDSAINKHYVKQLRVAVSLLDIRQALQDIGSDRLDVQAVSALGSTLAGMVQGTASSSSSSSSDNSSSSSGSSGSASSSTPAGVAQGTASSGGSSSGTSSGRQQQQAPDQHTVSDSLASLQVFGLKVWSPLVLSRLPLMDAAGLSICIQAAATLRLSGAPAAELTDSLMQAYVPHMHASSPRVQSSTLWGLVKLGARPPQLWLKRWAHASARKLPAYSMRDLSMAAWALAQLDWRAPDAWTSRMLSVLMQHLTSQGHMQQPMSQGYMRQPTPQGQGQSSDVNMQHLLPHGHGQVDGAWDRAPQSPVASPQPQQSHYGPTPSIRDSGADNVQPAASPRLPQHDDMPVDGVASSELRCVAVTVWSLARLKVLPEPELLDACLIRTCDLMQTCGSSLAGPDVQPTAAAASLSQCVAMLSNALVAFQHHPSRAFLHAFLTTTSVCMPSATPQELMVMLMAACNWRVTAPAAWMACALQRSAATMHLFTPQGLVLLLDAVTQLGHRPPAAWMHAYMTALACHMAHMTPLAGAQVLACLGALGYRPPPRLHAALQSNLLRHGHSIPSKRWFPALLAAQLLVPPVSTPTSTATLATTAAITTTTLIPSTPTPTLIPSTSAPMLIPSTPATTLIPSTPAARILRPQQPRLPQTDLSPPASPAFHRPTTATAAGDSTPAMSEGDLRQALLTARNKLGHCTAINLAHLVWAMVLWSQQQRPKAESNSSGELRAENSNDGGVPTTDTAWAGNRPVHEAGPRAEGSDNGPASAPDGDAARSGSRPVHGAAARGGVFVPASFVPSVLAALRQKAVAAAPSDVTSLIRALAALLAPRRLGGMQGSSGAEMEAGRHADWPASPVPGCTAVLESHQLCVLLEACTASLHVYSLTQLTHVLEAVTALGGTCPPDGVVGSVGRTGVIPVDHMASDGLLGTQGSRQQAGGRDTGQLMCTVAQRCVQLLLEEQQAVAAAAQRQGMRVDRQQRATERPRGVRGMLLEQAVVRVLAVDDPSGTGTLGVEDDMLCAWRVLLGAGFVHCLGRVQQQQLCMALYRAAEQRVQACAFPPHQQAAWVVAAHGLAARMPVPPPAGWLEDVSAGEGMLAQPDMSEHETLLGPAHRKTEMVKRGSEVCVQ